MDENEVIDQNPLAQVAQATIAPQAEQALAVTKPAVAATAQPSEYEKAIAEYRRQQQQLIERQRELIDSLNTRIQPSDYLSAMSQGFGDPRNLSFASGIAGAAGNVSAIQAAEQKRAQELAKMKLELGMQELGMSKENVEFAKAQDMRKALGQMINASQQTGVAGQPGAASPSGSGSALIPQSVAPILNVMAQMNPESAIKYIADLAKDDAKRPDAIKAMETYISMLPPEMQGSARAYAARANVFGKPSEISEAKMKIYERARSGVITPEIAARELALLEPPSMSGVRTESIAAPSAAPAPSISGIPTSSPTAVGAPSPRSMLSPQAQEDVAKAEITEDIKAKAAAREQAYKKMEEDLRTSESSASAATSTINSLNRFLEASPSASAGGLQPLFTNVKNLLSSLGISADSLVNEQKMSAAIDQVLLGKMESMGSAARGLTDKDMEMMRNSLPRLNTDRRAREEIAKIIMKSKANDLEDYRVRRVNESENFPEMARVRPAPRFYMDWIRKTEDFKQLRDQVGRATTQQAKDDVMKRFDAYYGLGVSRQLLR